MGVMRDRSANLVLPRYNNAAGTTTPSPSTSPNCAQRPVALERGDSILLDIEGGAEVGDGSKTSQVTWWQSDVMGSPFRTAVVGNVGTAMSSGWSRARGAIFGSSFTSYLRRLPSFDKPFDLKDIPSGPESI